MSTAPNILFLIPYPLGRAPSQRFRVEAHLPLLDEAGISYTVKPFLDEATWRVLYQGGSLPRKAWGIVRGFLKRAATVLTGTRGYSTVFIHREAAPLGPPIFEWWLRFVARKRIVYDFDDAIWIESTSAQNRLAASLKAAWKVRCLCRWSAVVAGGNDYLCAYARTHTHGRVVRIPTVVDTRARYNRIKAHQQDASDAVPVIGWTGSHSTLRYLDELMPVLQELQERRPFRFLVIADQKPELPLRNWDFVPWNEASEIEDLLRMDIGVMPLTPDPWSEGKCGFKLIQYLALGIPAVASPVGVNQHIIEDGVNGFLAQTKEQWTAALEALLVSPARRAEAGMAGRQKIEAEYSQSAIAAEFIALFRPQPPSAL